MSDDRRSERGKSARRSGNPLNAITDMLAAAWGTAVGIGCTVLGIKRRGEGKGTESAARAQQSRPEGSADMRPKAAPSGQAQQQSGTAAKAKSSAKVAPIAKGRARRLTTGAQATRRGARQTPPAKGGAAAKQETAAKPAGTSDKGGVQPKAGQQPSRAAGARASGRAAPRPKASDKHPTPPRPGAAARAEPPASSGPRAVAAATAPGERPPAFDSPRGGKADDLKRITGLGPKLEEKLNGLGIYHYDQIAGWGEGHVAWIDRELTTRGRVARDDWVGQAAAFTSGPKPASDKGPAA